MASKILMPKLGLTMKTGTVIKWLKDEGDAVREKEPVMEIETEKLSYNVESPADGVLLKKLAVEGERYPIAHVLGYVGQPGEVTPDDEYGTETAGIGTDAESRETVFSVPAARADGGRVFISPVAKKLAAQLGLDYKKITGTGPNGRIVKADVLNYKAEPASGDICISDAAADMSDVSEPASTAAVAAETDVIIPYTGIRRAIGENMSRAWSAIPMVTHHVSADVSSLIKFREILNLGVEDRAERISINDLLLKLTAMTLIKMPIMNASLTDAGIVCHRCVNIGMATAIDNGLVVPVLRGADKKGLLEISREAKDLAIRARAGGLKPDELHGATFTVSNLGGYGSVDYFTPIINPPEAGILGVGRVKETAIPVGGEIAIRPVMGLSLTYDHRIVDGAAAAEFMRAFIKLLGNPARAVL